MASGVFMYRVYMYVLAGGLLLVAIQLKSQSCSHCVCVCDHELASFSHLDSPESACIGLLQKEPDIVLQGPCWLLTVAYLFAKPCRTLTNDVLCAHYTYQLPPAQV